MIRELRQKTLASTFLILQPLEETWNLEKNLHLESIFQYQNAWIFIDLVNQMFNLIYLNSIKRWGIELKDSLT